jgi:ABC-type dipeptide/oligopeptide/nickel transport system permease subunit
VAAELADSARTTASPVIAEATRPRSWRYSRLGRLLTEPSAVFGTVILGIFIFAAIAAPLIAPHDPKLTDLRKRNVPPAWLEGGSTEHLLGTDPVGQDLLSRIIYGARVSLTVGIVVTILAALLGIAVGLVAGYWGGAIDEILMRIAELFLVFPFILLAVTVIAVLGSGLRNLIIVLVVTGWVQYSRLVRSQVLTLRGVQYVDAARVAGSGDVRIIVRHILPNLLASVVVLATLQTAFVLLTEAALSFLGLGIDPSTPTWGAMVNQGRTYIYNAWWVITFPGLAILLAVLAINMVGDWLRDALDPTLRVV